MFFRFLYCLALGTTLVVSQSEASDQIDCSETDQKETRTSDTNPQAEEQTTRDEGVDVSMDADQTSEKSDVLESEQQGEAEQKPARLAQLTLDALEGVESLSAKQKEVLTLALKLGRDYPDNHYKYGSADLKQGGFDCSGAMYFILKQSGFQPPRTSSSQYDWVEKGGRLTKVSPEITSLDDPIFNKLKPGDLLFWSHTYQPTDGRTNGVTHVQMYLGREKKESRPVMIGSSDGRSYRGRRQDGYAVFDFRLPRKESKQKFVGFGSPPAP